eukprot:gene1150-10664_t
MNFSGQKLAENIYYYLILFSGIFGFIYGFQQQSVSDMMFVFLSGVVLAVILTCPDWPFYNSKPEKWLEPLKEEEIQKPKKNTKTSKFILKQNVENKIIRIGLSFNESITFKGFEAIFNFFSVDERKLKGIFSLFIGLTSKLSMNIHFVFRHSSTSKIFKNNFKSISTLKKQEAFKFYDNFKTNNDQNNKLPNSLNKKTEREFIEYFEALDKVRLEEKKIGNIPRVEELDQLALNTITILRESGISSLKLQTFYQYLISPLDQK